MNLCRAIPIWMVCATGVDSLVGITSSVGFQRAFTWGIIARMVPLALIWLVGLFILPFHRDRPVCLCGRCRSEEYRYLSMEKRNGQRQ